MDFIGMQISEKIFAKLMSWFGSQGLLRNSNFELATIFYDSLNIIAPNEVRMSASIILDNLIKSDNTVSAVSFPKGDNLIGHFEIGLEEFEQCWTLMFEQIYSGGSKKTDQPVFQLHHNNFKEHPEKKKKNVSWIFTYLLSSKILIYISLYRIYSVLKISSESIIHRKYFDQKDFYIN